MERHYAVWSAFGFIVIGILAVYYILQWCKNYIHRVKAVNPSKAALVSCLFCLAWMVAFVCIRAYLPVEDGLNSTIREVLLAGIVGSGFFAFLFGGSYIAYLYAMKLDKRTKEIINNTNG